jgi:ATP-dependent exoDNAse (exonuclease V) beta subunit (contains helicase and exonuclease domains)
VEYLTVPADADLREHHCDHYSEFATAEPEHDTELEAMALAARLSQILAEPLQVYPEENEIDDNSGESELAPESGLSGQEETAESDRSPAPRDIEPSDVAILIRSRTHLKKYERALEEVDVPYSVASGIGFYESTEITALLNLFQALADPSDERALYAALRSPLFGLTDDTLAQLKLHDDSIWNALATSEHQELQDAFEYLQEWRHLAGLGEEEPAGFDGSWAAYLTRILEDTVIW